MVMLTYKNHSGDTAIIQETEESGIQFILKDKAGTILKKKDCKNLRGAKTALGMTGPWIGFNPQH